MVRVRIICNIIISNDKKKIIIVKKNKKILICVAPPLTINIRPKQVFSEIFRELATPGGPLGFKCEP